MNTIKQHALLAFGLIAALQLGTAQAQSEHAGHHAENAPAAQASPRATQPHHEGMDPRQMREMHEQHMSDPQMRKLHEQHMSDPKMREKHERMMQGMDHDKMQEMHKEHRGSGHMDHGDMGKGPMSKDMPKGAEQGKPHDH